MERTEQRWALCVGVNEYGAQPGLPNLRCAVNNACLLYKTLVDQYNFRAVLLAAPQDVARGPHAQLAGQSEGNGTADEIVEQVNCIRRRMADTDMFVFFYAGHAYASAQSPGFLAPFGAVLERPSTHLLWRTLFGELSALPCCGQMLLFDCLLPDTMPVAAGHMGPNRPGGGAALLASGATPDLVETNAEKEHSLFLASVVEFLKEKVPVGGCFRPEELFAHVVQRTQDVAEVKPSFWGQVPAIRSGQAAWRLRRPGLALGVKRRYTCKVGERLALERPVRRGGDGGSPLQWELSLKNSAFNTGEQRKTFLDLEAVQFEFAGEYELDLAVSDPDTQEQAFASITVVVEEADPKPLTLCTTGLPICFKGEPYHALLDIEGGLPPYELEVSGLPSGLTWALENPTVKVPKTRIRLEGTVPEDAAAGTAWSPDANPVAFHVRFGIKDAAGAKKEEVRRLLVISRKDYCRIEGGSFWVGCRRDIEKEAAIVRMCTGMVQRLSERRVKLPDHLTRALRMFAAGMAREALEQVLQVNPGAEVELAEFYIRKYPVTNLAWREYVRANQHATPPPWIPDHWDRENPNFFPDEEATLPVVCVPYKAILAYLQWKGTRLPTAWEWERAARGRDGRLFPWGDEYNADFCNSLDSGVGHLTPVDRYDAHCSPDKVCDMVGNAAEWVDRRTFQGGLLYQPFRGGSYLDPCLYALTFYDSREAGVRYGADEDQPEVGETAFGWLGFRDVVDLDPDPSEPQELIPIPEILLDANGKKVRVRPFAMSRYAVSNLEYWDFVKATGHRMPDGWRRSAMDAFPFPSLQRHLPVVGVTYRDALAFCLWKSRVLRGIIRLPTADQWLAAVDGGQGRRFPWGNEFDLQRCNSLVSGWGKRIPVFALKAGCNAQGVYNLVGNVCEWITPFEVRGGGWQDDCEKLAAYGFRQVVTQIGQYEFKRRDVGFRYVENSSKENTR